jgi:hypothetical protein
MATLDQYTEVVAAYGYTLPPPPKEQTNRLGVALLYAAIGTALGTMTGTGMAVVSLQPGGAAAWAHHLTLPNFSGPAQTAHVHSAPVVAHVTPAPAPARGSTAVAATPAPAAVVAQTASVSAANVPPAPVHAVVVAPAVPAPVLHPSLLARVVAPSVVEASVDAAPLDRELTARREAVKARLAVAPVVHHSAVPVLASASSPNAPPAKAAALHIAATVPVPAVEPDSLDEQVAPVANFYSEGDAAVVDYDSTLDTILTDDGKSFVIGPTVAMSSAASWNDYRSNVHYRCDQGGKCTLTRNGVVALSARQI